MTRVERLTNSSTGGPVHVEVSDGKIVRILPIDLDESDGPSWQIEARGRTFAPPRRTTLSPWTVAHKSSIYSPKRILTPLKRVDFDPSGAARLHRPRRPQLPESRRIRVRAHKLGRGLRPGGRRDRADQAGAGPDRDAHHPRLAPHVGQRRLPLQRLLPLHGPGRHDLRRAQPRQLGGLALGRHAHVGLQPPPGHPRAVRPARRRAQEHRDGGLLVGRPRVDHGLLCRLREHVPRGSGSRSSGSRWSSSTPTSTTPPASTPTSGWRRAPAPTWLWPWPSPMCGSPKDTYDIEYVAERTTGFDEWRSYVLGESDGTAKTPEWAEAESGVPGPRDPGAGPGVGVQAHHAGRGRPGRHGRRVPRRHRQRVGAGHGGPRRDAGAGQAGQQHLGDDGGRARPTSPSSSPATPREASPATPTIRLPVTAGSIGCSPRVGP